MKMKFIVSFISSVSLAISLYSCKKEADTPPLPSYSEIDRSYIVSREANMTTTGFEASNSTGLLLKTGNICLYKTNENRYGKMEVISIDIPDNYKITFKAVTYNTDGTVYKTTTALSIAGTWSADLDEMLEVAGNPEREFFWQRQTASDTYFTPTGTAKFIKLN